VERVHTQLDTTPPCTNVPDVIIRTEKTDRTTTFQAGRLYLTCMNCDPRARGARSSRRFCLAYCMHTCQWVSLRNVSSRRRTTYS